MAQGAPQDGRRREHRSRGGPGHGCQTSSSSAARNPARAYSGLGVVLEEQQVVALAVGAHHVGKHLGGRVGSPQRGRRAVELLGVVLVALVEDPEEARRVDLVDLAGGRGEHLACPTQGSLQRLTTAQVDPAADVQPVQLVDAVRHGRHAIGGDQRQRARQHSQPLGVVTEEGSVVSAPHHAPRCGRGCRGRGLEISEIARSRPAASRVSRAARNAVTLASARVRSRWTW